MDHTISAKEAERREREWLQAVANKLQEAFILPHLEALVYKIFPPDNEGTLIRMAWDVSWCPIQIHINRGPKR